MLILSTLLVVFICTFLAAAIAVAVAWLLLQRRAGEPVWSSEGGGAQELPLLLKNDSLSTVGLLAGLLERFDFVQVIKARLAEAEIDWSVGRFTALMLLCGAVVIAVLANVSRFPLLGALILGCGAALLPYGYVLRRRARRMAKFEEQLPDALDYLSRALRAGHPFGVCLDMLVEESLPPLAQEMRKTVEERKLGLSWDDALQNLARRVPLADVGFFAAAVQLQNRTGGKLGDVLGRLAETMRERFALRGEIRAIATHGRVTGLVLTLIPVIVAAVMTLVNPGYLNILISNPFGKNLIIAAIVCLVLAHFVIRRIVNIKL